MSEFSVKVGGDFTELLRGFQQLEQRAQGAGSTIEKNLSEGIQGFSSKSLAALNQELNRLQQRQLKVAVDSSAFQKAGARIKEVQGLISTVQRQQLLIQVDDRSVTALQTKLTDLQNRQTKVSVDSREFVDLQRQINATEKELQQISQRKVLIDADANSFLAITARLRNELNGLQERQLKVDVDSREFAQLSQQIDRVEGELTALDRRKLLITADPSSIIALRSRLGELQGQLEKTQIGSQRFRELQREIQKTEAEVARATQSTRTLSSILNADIGGGIFGQLAGLASAGAVASFFKSSIDEAVKLETITRKLSNTLGNQGAAGALTFTRKLSDELGLSFNTLANTFGGFTAAATSAGVPMQQQRDLFAAVSKSAQSLGLSNDELSGSLLALQQVASKGVVQMEELRGQLGERLPVAFGATAKGLGLTQQELGKLVESGGLRAEQFFDGLTKGLNEINSDSGGAPTAAQNFQKLSNAWTDLQASFGTSLLPTITKTVNELAGALEGLEVSVGARELRESFGLTADEATQLVGSLKAVQEQYGLTVQQSKNLLSNAIANTGASRGWFGELNLGGERFGKVQENLIDLAIKYRDANPDIAAQRREEAIEMAKVQEALKAAALVDEARKTQAQELAKIYGQQQIEALNGQIAVGQQLVGLSKALADQEQSRFAVVKAGLEFELSKAQERGASEGRIRAIKKQIQEQDRQALEARFQALGQQQQLETKLLELAQQKARTEADLSVAQARVDILKAEADLSKAKNDQEKIAAETQIQVQKQILGIRQEQAGLLAQTQPLERAIAAATAETARNGLQAQAAQQGFKFAADGTLQAVNAISGASGRVSVLTTKNAGEQERFRRIAQQAGIAVQTAADGSLVLGRRQSDVANATGSINNQLSGLNKALDTSASTAGETATEVGNIGSGLADAGKPAGDIADAFISTSKKAPAAAQGARDFAAFLSSAKVFAERIAGLPIANQMAAVASSTAQAAGAAKTFHDWLQRASALPGSRWTGGPVEAGESYKINELGQESLLSGGRLSLINAAPNSLWRAPTNGTVIPAGITARLQEQGALPSQPGAAPIATAGNSNAALAVEVGKLRQEVGELARKNWNVNVAMKTGPTGSQVIRQMMR